MSGCYGCGSPEGSAGALCPSCSAKRLAAKGGAKDRAQAEGVHAGRPKLDSRPPPIVKKSEISDSQVIHEQITRGGSAGIVFKLLTLVLGGGVLYFILVVWPSGPMLLSPLPEKAHARCEKSVADLESGSKRTVSAAELNLYKMYGPAMCQQALDACRHNPDGSLCNVFVGDTFRFF
jgi:hypothetical protein